MSLSDYWATQRVSAKRRKTDDGSQSLPDRKREAGTSNPLNKPLDTPDSASDGGSPRHDVPPSSQTDFESSLPAVPDEAVEYESDTDDRDENRSLHERLENGRWQKWKSSIYLDAFILALETVLEEETHLFNEAEMEVFRQWKELPYESQYLYAIPIIHEVILIYRLDTFGSSFAKHLHGIESIGSAIIRMLLTCLVRLLIFGELVRYPIFQSRWV